MFATASTPPSRTGPLVLWLAMITLLLIVLAGFAIAVFHVTVNGSGHTGFAEAVWQSMLRTIDSGTMSGDNGWEWRILSLFITLGGGVVLNPRKSSRLTFNPGDQFVVVATNARRAQASSR